MLVADPALCRRYTGVQPVLHCAVLRSALSGDDWKRVKTYFVALLMRLIIKNGGTALRYYRLLSQKGGPLASLRGDVDCLAHTEMAWWATVAPPHPRD